MIIGGGSRSNWRWWNSHLTNAEKNESVRLVEVRGLAAEDVREALREMDFIAGGSNTKNFFYPANMNPKAHEKLTDAQWEQATDILEKHLGLEGQPRFVVEHTKADGRTHRHPVWLRLNEDLKAIPDSFTARDHERAAREIEETFGLEPVESVLTKDRDSERPERRARSWETFRSQATGLDPEAMREEVTALFRGADSGQAFKAALEDAGYILARGDRRDYCIIDSAGHEHSLGRRVAEKAAAVRARLSDIERDELPSVAEAREMVRAEADEGSKPAAPDTQEQPETPLDVQQAADFLTEPDARMTPFVADALAARFGDGFAPSEPGARSRAEESIPGARATDAEGGEDAAAVTDCIRTHAAGERPQRVTPWSFAGLAERLTRYADLFWNFVRDEHSGQQPEPQAEPPQDERRAPGSPAPDDMPAAPTEPEAPRGWAARVMGSVLDKLRPQRHEPPGPEPDGDLSRPGANGNAPAPDAADPQREATAGTQAATRPAAPLSNLERFAARSRAPADDDRLPHLQRFQTRGTAAQTPPQATPAARAAPEPSPPEPDFD